MFDTLLLFIDNLPLRKILLKLNRFISKNNHTLLFFQLIFPYSKNQFVTIAKSLFIWTKYWFSFIWNECGTIYVLYRFDLTGNTTNTVHFTIKLKKIITIIVWYAFTRRLIGMSNCVVIKICSSLFHSNENFHFTFPSVNTRDDRSMHLISTDFTPYIIK